MIWDCRSVRLNGCAVWSQETLRHTTACCLVSSPSWVMTSLSEVVRRRWFSWWRFLPLWNSIWAERCVTFCTPSFWPQVGHWSHVSRQDALPVWNLFWSFLPPPNQGLVGEELFLHKWFGIMRYRLDPGWTVLNAPRRTYSFITCEPHRILKLGFAISLPPSCSVALSLSNWQR